LTSAASSAAYSSSACRRCTATAFASTGRWRVASSRWGRAREWWGVASPRGGRTSVT
jgi:hypothetical protein